MQCFLTLLLVPSTVLWITFANYYTNDQVYFFLKISKLLIRAALMELAYNTITPYHRAIARGGQLINWTKTFAKVSSIYFESDFFFFDVAFFRQNLLYLSISVKDVLLIAMYIPFCAWTVIFRFRVFRQCVDAFICKKFCALASCIIIWL